MALKINDDVNEICEMCRSVLNELKKPDQYWHVHVARASWQPNIILAYLDYDVMSDPRSNVLVGRFAIDWNQWRDLSQDGKMFLVRTRCNELITELEHASL